MFEDNVVGRVTEGEENFERFVVERVDAFEAGRLHEVLAEALDTGGEADDFDVGLPGVFGQAAGGVIAVGAFGIVEVEEDFALLERVGLAVDGDGVGGFGAGLAGLGNAVGGAGEDEDGGEDEPRAFEPFAVVGPPAGEGGHDDHGSIGPEEGGADGAFEPGEAGAIHALEGGVVPAHVDHEGDEHAGAEQGAPAAVAGDDEQQAAEDFGDAEEESGEDGKVGRDEHLVHAGGCTEVIGEFPEAGSDEENPN